MSYSELLRDPRWQRKRLEVMEAANFTCVECGDSSTTLNVHHTHYRKGAKPWEYEQRELLCLCEPCHGEITELTQLIQRLIGRMRLPAIEKLLRTAIQLVPETPAPTERAPSADPVVARLNEIDRAMPLATSEEKDALMLEKISLRDELRASGKRSSTWKAFR